MLFDLLWQAVSPSVRQKVLDATPIDRLAERPARRPRLVAVVRGSVVEDGPEFGPLGPTVLHNAAARSGNGASATAASRAVAKPVPRIVPVGTRDTLTQTPTYGFCIVAHCWPQR